MEQLRRYSFVSENCRQTSHYICILMVESESLAKWKARTQARRFFFIYIVDKVDNDIKMSIWLKNTDGTASKSFREANIVRATLEEKLGKNFEFVQEEIIAYFSLQCRRIFGKRTLSTSSRNVWPAGRYLGFSTEQGKVGER